MKFIHQIFILGLTAFFFTSCASYDHTYASKQRPYHTPKNWQKPIIKVKSSNEAATAVVSRDSKKISLESEPGAQIMTRQVKTTDHSGFIASYYHEALVNNKTYSGEIYLPGLKTVAHPSLPMGTIVRVTNTENKQTTIARVNDRINEEREIRLSKAAAIRLGVLQPLRVIVLVDVMRYPMGYKPGDTKETKKLVLQVAAFNSEKKAQRFKALLANRYRTLSFLVDNGRNGAYRVITSPYASKSEASLAVNLLAKDGIESFVRSYN